MDPEKQEKNPEKLQKKKRGKMALNDLEFDFRKSLDTLIISPLPQCLWPQKRVRMITYLA